MTSLPDRIVLHIGAHKTASTHLQKSIESAGALSGVAFCGPQVLRGPGRSVKDRLRLTKGATVEEAQAALAEMATGQARLVISDENFAGGLRTGWGRIPMPLYPNAPDRVAAFCATVARAGGPDVDLCLAIRDPAMFLTSAYSQVLHGKRVVLPEKYIAKNPISGVDWVDYVRRLQAVSGLRSLTVWRQEDYGQVFARVCETLVGDASVTALPGRSQQRMSAKALEAVLQAKADGLPNMVAEAVRRFPISKELPAFTLFDAAAREQSAALYEAQCAALAETPGVTFLSA